jgi:hypothetical protein
MFGSSPRADKRYKDACRLRKTEAIATAQANSIKQRFKGYACMAGNPTHALVNNQDCHSLIGTASP